MRGFRVEHTTGRLNQRIRPCGSWGEAVFPLVQEGKGALLGYGGDDLATGRRDLGIKPDGSRVDFVFPLPQGGKELRSADPLVTRDVAARLGSPTFDANEGLVVGVVLELAKTQVGWEYTTIPTHPILLPPYTK